jgi:hypothetical protein
VRFDVALVDRFGRELALDHHVGIGKALVQISSVEHRA